MKSLRGFTLVEIAIVLVIIGLLLGGILKGQELINSAKAKNLSNDFRSIPVLIYGYQDKYRTLPGDDPAVRMHLGASAVQIPSTAAGGTAGNGRLDGDWDTASSGDESLAIWQHLRLAGLAAGPTNIGDAAYRPSNATGGPIGIESVSRPTGAPYIQGISGSLLLCSSGILGTLAKQVDRGIDDGNGATGQVRIVPASGYLRNGSPGLDNAANPDSVDDAGQFTVCMGF